MATAWLKDLDAAAVHLVIALDNQPDPQMVLQAARALMPIAPLTTTTSAEFQKVLKHSYPKGWMKQMLWVLAAYIDLLTETAVQNAALTPGVAPAGYSFDAEREAIKQFASQARDYAAAVQEEKHPSLIEIRKKCEEVYSLAMTIIEAVSSGEWTRDSRRMELLDEDEE